MRVRDLMTRDVETVGPELAAAEAWRRMRQRRIRHLVVMRRGEPCGIVSERDLGGARGESVRRAATVAELMTPLAVTVDPGATVRQAANLMRGRVIGCLPVVDGSKLVGIVTTSDLLEMVGRSRGVGERRAPRTRRGVFR